MKEALLVIDMQPGFLQDKRPDDLEVKVGVMGEMLYDFRLRSVSVVYALMFPKSNGLVIDELSPDTNSSLLYKNFDDAFYATNLESMVNGHVVHIVGCNLDFCVKSTAISACNLGLSVILYTNAVLAKESSIERTERTLDGLKKYYPHIQQREYTG